MISGHASDFKCPSFPQDTECIYAWEKIDICSSSKNATLTTNTGDETFFFLCFWKFNLKQ